MYRTIIATMLVLMVVASPTQTKSAVSDVFQVNLTKDHSQTYNLKELDKTKAIMITLAQSKDLKMSPFELKMAAGTNEITCPFKYINNLCVLEHSSNQVNVTLTCLADECKFNIVFSQRNIANVGDKLDYRKKLAVPGEIFKIAERKFNSILEIYAERQEHKVLSEELTVYSNIHAFPLQQVPELDTNSAIFGLKHVKGGSDQYVFIDSRSNKTQHFKAVIKSHKGQLRDGISIIDFIQNYGNHSHNNFTVVGSINHNLQINVRVFSPRDSKGIPLTLNVKGKQSQSAKEVDVGSLVLNPIEFQANKFFDFTYSICKKVIGNLKFLFLTVTLGEVQDKSIFFELEIRDAESFQINIFDHIFFNSAEEQQLLFKVAPLVKFQLSDGDKDIQIITKANQGYFSNIQSCSLQKGCDIEIKSKKACSSCSFKFSLKDQDILNHIIYYEVKDDAIEGKIDIEEELYFKYPMNGKGVTQIIVNTINVVIYASFDTDQRCKVPTASCHQYAINQQNPLIVINKDQQPAELIVGVVGQEKTTFKVRFINQLNGLTVKLGEKFSYLMDDGQKDIQLRLEIPKEYKQEVHFNLISPIHSTRLTVTNGDKDEKKSTESLDGYISFVNKDIISQIFIIKIEKINLFYDEYLHFTLYITSNTAYARLDTTTPHYQKYYSQTQLKFLFEYEPSDVNAINIYTQNLEKSHTQMNLQIRYVKPSDQQASQKPIISKKLVKDYEFIVLDNIDQCDDINCELQLTIKNSLDVILEQTISLLSSQSLISLDDSIWSVFEINQLTKKSHFYFIPRHQGRPIKILFNTQDNHLYVNYRIFNTKNSINPADWPFEHASTSDYGFIPSHQQIDIQANDTQLQKCWPTCVIIVNLNEAYEGPQQVDSSILKSYKIMATNSIVELLEDTKMDFSLRSEQVRDFFVKLTTKFDVLTFFTYYKVGRARLNASFVYKNEVYLLEAISFNEFQTIIPRQQIIRQMFKRNIQQDKIENVLLKISILGQTDLKMTLEYSSALKDVVKLPSNTLYQSNLGQQQSMIYQFLPERDFTLKLYRHQGFPIINIFKCTEKDYLTCFSNNKKQFENELQEYLKVQERVKKSDEKEIETIEQPKIQIFIEKTMEYSDIACSNCIYFVWVHCLEGSLRLTLNLRNQNTEVELKEMHSLLEKVQPYKKNRYLINIAHNQVAKAGITAFDGTIQIVITTKNQIVFNTTLSPGDEYKEFQIDGQDEDDVLADTDNQMEVEKKEQLGYIRKAGENHVFKHAYITVSSVDQKPAEFSIVYNIGQNSRTYLQDGVIAKSSLGSTSAISYFYRNPNQKQHPYFTLTAEQSYSVDGSNTPAENLVSVKFYYYPNAGNLKKRETFVPELPPKRNENYIGNSFTAVYELPRQYELYEIEIIANAYVWVTASINHQELVYLPIGFEYLLKLHPDETLNVVIETPKEEYLELQVQKCAMSPLRLQYTNDANEFKQGVFAAESKIITNNFKQYIKTKPIKSRTMHFKFIAPPNVDALFTISAVGRNGNFINEEDDKFKPGGEGIINYKIIQTDTVQISFKPAICEKKDCLQQGINYFLVVAQNMERVYEQLNCAGAYFVPQAPLQTADIIEIGAKNFDSRTNVYKYGVKLKKGQDYVGIKGVAKGSKEQIQYIPIHIQDFWAELSSVSFGIYLTVSLSLALVLTIVIIVSTKLARRGYKPISSDQ